MKHENIKIRHIKVEDYSRVLNWSKDVEFCIANGWEQNRSEEELYQWWLNCVNSKNDDFIRLGIEHKGMLIGYGDLACIIDQTSEVGIAIGESKLWGKGIGANSLEYLMEYAFKKFGITIFYAETHETNVRSRKMLEKVGFIEISRQGHEEYLGVETQLIQFRLSS